MSPAPGCFYISETSSLWVIFNVWFWNRILKIDTLLPPLPLQKCHRGLTTWLSGQPPGTKSCLAWNKLPHFPISVQPTHPLSYSRSWVRPNLKILHFQDFQLKKNTEAISILISDTYHMLIMCTWGTASMKRFNRCCSSCGVLSLQCTKDNITMNFCSPKIHVFIFLL